MYISAWKIHKEGIRNILDRAVDDGKVSKGNIVWYGPSGDVVVANDPASLDEQYADYTNEGLVSKYLDNQECVIAFKLSDNEYEMLMKLTQAEGDIPQTMRKALAEKYARDIGSAPA
jgi:hypothetical protein